MRVSLCRTLTAFCILAWFASPLAFAQRDRCAGLLRRQGPIRIEQYEEHRRVAERAAYDDFVRQHGSTLQAVMPLSDIPTFHDWIRGILTTEGALVREAFGFKGDLQIPTGDLLTELWKVETAIRDATILKWVNTRARAFYVLKRLPYHPASRERVADEMLSRSPYFRNSIRTRMVPGSFLTFSLEKEGNHPEIAFYYRPDDRTDEAWLELTPTERIQILLSLSPNRVVSTSLKPEFLGEFSKEVASLSDREAVGNAQAYEIRHRHFEVNFEEFKRQVREISSDLGHSDIHTHVVFDLPRDYPQVRFNGFVRWIKHGNDFLLLKGMEEGLHPNWLTGAATLYGSDLRVVKTLPRTLQEIQQASHKYFAMGLRSGIYGSEPADGPRKIGIELRDFTRSLKVYEDVVTSTANRIRDEAWSRRIGEEEEYTFDLSVRNESFLMRQVGLSEGFRGMLRKANPMMSLPLHEFDTGRYFDYSLGQWISPDAGQVHRMRAAREAYSQSLKDLENEYWKFLLNGTTITREELNSAIMLNLTEWAKKARISELYRGI